MANSANEFQIVLQTILDSNVKNNIQGELQKLNDLSITIKKAKLDDSAIKEIQSQLSAINLDINLNSTGKMVEEFARMGEEAGKVLNEEMENAMSSSNNNAANIFDKWNSGINEYRSSMAEAQKQAGMFADTTNEAKISIDAAVTAYTKLGEAAAAYGNDTSSLENQQQLIEAEQTFKNAIDQVKESYELLKNTIANDKSIANLHGQIQNFYNSNTKAYQQYGSQLKQMLNETASGSRLTVNELNQLQLGFKNIQNACAAANLTGRSFFDQLAKGLKQFAGFGSMAMSIQTVFRVIQSGITDVKNLDTALIDLRKTTTMTTSELNDFYFAANDVAKQMGVTTEEIINQAAAWSRLGFSSQEAATQMAALSSQFAAISPGMDVDTATNGLVSIMKAYGYGVDEVLDGVMSKINAVGNTAATTNEEIVDMLERSSSAMAVANTSMEQTIALETAAVEVTRNAANVGTAYKTVAARLRGYDEELDAYVNDVEELSGKIADLTKTAKTPGGISLFTDSSKTTYRSIYDILKDISDIWDDITDKEQAALLETIGGKRLPQYTVMCCGTHLIAGTA